MEELERIKKHNEILNYLLDYKQKHNDFTFSLRKNHNNHEEDKSKCRLCKGYWFQGADNYIFVPLYKIGCKDNKTKTIGFVYQKDKQYIEIVYKKLSAPSEIDYAFYNELLDYLNNLTIFNIEKKHDKKYFFIFKENNLNKNLSFFIDTLRKKSDELLKKYNLFDKYHISNTVFQESIERINEIKKGLNSNLTLIKPRYVNINNKSYQTKNTILYGPPGVGKTYNHKKLISLIESGKNQKDIFDAIRTNDLKHDGSLFETVKEENRFKFVTFHQSYSYEDFIEGFRPNEDGSIKLEDGIFKEIAKKAQTQPQKNFYLLIDEINRGNISKIFGELITLIEDDKRDEIEVTLPYSKESFKVPSNLYIIATMNSTDKSIALIDVALRRRFTFLKMEPLDLLVHERVRERFNNLNKFIEEKLGKDYLVGHSYFDIHKELDLDFVLEYKIKPLLEEYFYSDEEGLKEALEILSFY